MVNAVFNTQINFNNGLFRFPDPVLVSASNTRVAVQSDGEDTSSPIAVFGGSFSSSYPRNWLFTSYVNYESDESTVRFSITDANISGAYLDAASSIQMRGLTSYIFRDNDAMNGSSFQDVLYSFDGNDRIRAAGGDDFIHGGNGNDILDGNTGNDTIYGDAGNDTISGSSGNDTIYGGAGNDKIYGVDGADYFAFQSDSGKDRLCAFEKGVDVIMIDAGLNGTSITDFASLESHISFVGSDTKIDLGGANFIAIGGHIDFDSSDFMFF